MSVEEEKKRDAEKCLQIAEVAFSSKNFEKAERLLKKAERLYPTTLAKQMLKDVLNAKGEEITSRNSSIGSDDTDQTGYNSETSNIFVGRHQRTEEDKKGSDLCIDIANSAISEGRFDKAKNFLLKSLRIYPNDVATKLLENLDELEKNYSSTNYNGVGSSRLGNKEEAEKCIQIAEIEIASSRFARAERLLKKAERLCTTTRAKDLLRQIDDARTRGLQDTEELNKNAQNQQRTNRHENERRRQNNENERPRRIGPTPEQIEAIRRVKQGQNDFEILGVNKGCTVADVKKAFRRQTLLLHPDKNKAPGAKEAFMIVSEASERLKKKSSST